MYPLVVALGIAGAGSAHAEAPRLALRTVAPLIEPLAVLGEPPAKKRVIIHVPEHFAAEGRVRGVFATEAKKKSDKGEGPELVHRMREKMYEPFPKTDVQLTLHRQVKVRSFFLVVKSADGSLPGFGAIGKF